MVLRLALVLAPAVALVAEVVPGVGCWPLRPNGGEPSPRYSIRRVHVEVRWEPATSIVTHDADRDRSHCISAVIDDNEVKPGGHEKPPKERHADATTACLDGRDRRLRDPDPLRQIALAEVAPSSGPHHQPRNIEVFRVSCFSSQWMSLLAAPGRTFAGATDIRFVRAAARR
jgi:hypothetical protein